MALDTGDPRPQRPTTALQSLLRDNGAGAPLAAAAADVAAHRTGYSARTQAGTVVAYHVIAHDGIDPAVLRHDLLELGRSGSSVYADPSPSFSAWLASVEAGIDAVGAAPSSEPATRMPPIAIWYREDPDALVAAAIEVARLENIDAASVAVAVAVAGAVAAATLVMSGRDLVLAAAETASRGLVSMGSHRFEALAAASTLPRMIDSLRPMVGAPYLGVADAMSEVPAGLRPALAGIVVAADTERDPVMAIEDAAVGGGPDAGVVAGAILGARVGLRRWPWRVPNDTWFAEIGRRLVVHERELRDLPIPYAVEQRIGGARQADRGVGTD